MKKSTSARMYWAVSGILSLVFLGSLFFVPALQAQEIRSFGEERLLRTFREVYEFVHKNYVDEIDSDVLIEGAMKGMFRSLEDPHSGYLDIEDMRSLTDTTSGEFGGVGLYINKVRLDEDRPELDEWVEVVSPIDGTPASRAGLRSRDLIVAIEGESTAELSIYEVVKRLRGKPDSEVELTILRNMRNRFDVTLTRAIIEIPTVRYAGLQDDVGFLRIIQFTPRTAEQVEQGLRELTSEGYKNLILDLRTNPGGLLTAAIDTADLFFDNGLVVGTWGRIPDKNQAYYARKGIAIDGDAQIVVLINEGTASAAEILAGALKDRNRAVLVGVTSYGKGSVQQVRSLGDGGFRLTIAKYYTPSEEFIDKIGIEPDVVMDEPELSEEENDALIEIQEQKRIKAFLDRHGNDPGRTRINTFINSLRTEGYAVNEHILRRLLRLEIETRTTTVRSIYDLEYDLVLKEALRILKDGEVQVLLDNREPALATSAANNFLPTPLIQ